MKLTIGLTCAVLAFAMLGCSKPSDHAVVLGHAVIKFATDWRAEAEQGGFYEAAGHMANMPSAAST